MERPIEEQITQLMAVITLVLTGVKSEDRGKTAAVDQVPKLNYKSSWQRLRGNWESNIVNDASRAPGRIPELYSRIRGSAWADFLFLGCLWDLNGAYLKITTVGLKGISYSADSKARDGHRNDLVPYSGSTETR